MKKRDIFEMKIEAKNQKNFAKFFPRVTDDYVLEFIDYYKEIKNFGSITEGWFNPFWNNSNVDCAIKFFNLTLNGFLKYIKNIMSITRYIPSDYVKIIKYLNLSEKDIDLFVNQDISDERFEKVYLLSLFDKSPSVIKSIVRYQFIRKIKNNTPTQLLFDYIFKYKQYLSFEFIARNLYQSRGIKEESLHRILLSSYKSSVLEYTNNFSFIDIDDSKAYMNRRTKIKHDEFVRVYQFILLECIHHLYVRDINLLRKILIKQLMMNKYQIVITDYKEFDESLKKLFDIPRKKFMASKEICDDLVNNSIQQYTI